MKDHKEVRQSIYIEDGDISKVIASLEAIRDKALEAGWVNIVLEEGYDDGWFLVGLRPMTETEKNRAARAAKKKREAAAKKKAEKEAVERAEFERLKAKFGGSDA